jgi:Icc-related predicted phosphoesterase
VFIHTGDLTAGGSFAETAKFVQMLEARLERGGIGHMLLTPGNHDRTCFEWMDGVRSMTTDPRIHWLIDETFELDGKVFWGSPWTPPFNDWFWMADETKLARTYRAMPEKLDVLITHGPPRGVLDPGHDGSHVGSTALMYAVETRNIDHHVFGHLHAAGGLSKPVAFLDTKWGNIATQFHNVAAVDESYRLVRDTFDFEI